MPDQANKSGELRCAIITPDRRVLDVTVDSVVLPAHDGLIGVLRHRAPLLCKLGIGVARVGTGQHQRRVFIAGGFAQVLEDNITLLTPAAMEPEEVDRETAEAALQAAQNMRITDDASLRARGDAIARAKAQLSLIS
jgi:F-type H+-transporting ATPase subunit epsilon